MLVVSHIYLIVMAAEMQAVFRNFGHVKGYTGEKFLIIVYSFFCGHLIKFMTGPIVIFLVDTTDYACSDALKHFLWVLNDLDVVLFPLCFQVVFIGVMW